MEKLGLDLDEESPNDLKQTNPQEARKQSIQRCIQSLVHACRCQEQQCRQPSCLKMKRVVAHTKICKRKTNGGCPICKQLIALCCYHAKHCNEAKCLVPFCPNIKHKLKQQQLAQRVQQAELLRRRVAFMNTRSTPMVPPQAAICGPQNTATSVGLIPQMQGNAMTQAGQMGSVPSMQANQMGNQMMNPNTMASMNSMNANSGMIGTNPMIGNANQMQQQQMNTGNMMSTGPNMNVNTPMGTNNPMNPGNMMNTNNQMVGQMNNVNPMTTNAGNQMQQTQQVIYKIQFPSLNITLKRNC